MSKESRAQKKHGTFYVIFDIRSSSVGGAIVEVFKDKTPKIVYTHRSFITFSDTQDGDSFVNSMTALLGEVSQKVLNEGVIELKKNNHAAHIKSGIVFYSSPWYSSHIKEVSIKKKKPFVFKQEHFEEFIREETKKEATSKETTVVEKDITHVVINGYEVEDPFDKKIMELSISLYISEMANDSLQNIKDVLTESFPKVIFSHKTHPLALFSTLRGVFSHTSTFMFVDIGGEITDIGIVEHNSLIQSISIPYGRNYIIREIGKETGIKLEDIGASIEMIFNETIQDSQSKKILKSIDSVKSKWISQIKDAVDNVNVEIPRNIFLNSETDVRKMFKEFMKDESLYMKTENTTSMTNIITLDSTTFDHLIAYENKVKRDSFIEIETSFLYNNKINL